MTTDADGETLSGSEATCAAVPVDVEGKQAVWIFTEFETRESLKTLRDWLIPDHWPRWGGEMFKEMRPLGSLALRPSRSGTKQTHSNYLEVVEIGGHRLETELRCEFKSAEKWSATSLRPQPQHRGHAPSRPRLPDGGGCRRPEARQGPEGGRLHQHSAQHRRNRGLPGVGYLGAARDDGQRGPGGRRLNPDAGLDRRLRPAGVVVHGRRGRLHRRGGRAIDRDRDRHDGLLRPLRHRCQRTGLVGPLRADRHGERRQPPLPAPGPGLVASPGRWGWTAYRTGPK